MYTINEISEIISNCNTLDEIKRVLIIVRDCLGLDHGKQLWISLLADTRMYQLDE